MLILIQCIIISNERDSRRSFIRYVYAGSMLLIVHNTVIMRILVLFLLLYYIIAHAKEGVVSNGKVEVDTTSSIPSTTPCK